MSDNLIIVIAAILFFFWYRMQQAMAAALCQGGGISSGCGPSGLILGGQKIVVPGFGTACACQGRGVSSIFNCSPVRQGPVQSPVIGPVRVVPPIGSRFPIDVVPMGMAPQTTTLPKPIATHPAPNPAFCTCNKVCTAATVANSGVGITKSIGGSAGVGAGLAATVLGVIANLGKPINPYSEGPTIEPGFLSASGGYSGGGPQATGGGSNAPHKAN